MKAAVDIEREMASLSDEVQAMVDLATAENRELNAKEQKRSDEILGTGAKAGELDKLKSARDGAMRREALLSGKIANAMSRVDFPHYEGEGRSITNAEGKSCIVLNRGDSLAKTIRRNPSKPSNSFGHAVRAAVCGVNRGTPDYIRNAMTEGDNNRGGYTVPIEIADELVDLARARAVVLQSGARVVLMGSDTRVLPRINGDATYAVRGELDTIETSDIELTAVQLNALSVASMVLVSRELAEDSPTFVQDIESVLARGMATELDRLAIQGGTNLKPQGLLNFSEIAETGSVGAIDWTDLSAAATAIRGNNHEPGAAIMSPAIFGALNDIETGDGTNSARGWLGPPPSLANVSMFPSSNIGDANIILGDFSEFVWGLRTSIGIEATADGGDAFKKHGILIKVIWRGDFVPMRPAAFHRLAGVTAS